MFIYNINYYPYLLNKCWGKSPNTDPKMII